MIFVDEIRTYAVGNKDTGDLFRMMTTVFRQFRKQLHATIPVFDVGKKVPNKQENGDQTFAFSDSEDNSEVEYMEALDAGASIGGWS